MNLRENARQILLAALEAVNPFQAVMTHLQRDGNVLFCDSEAYNLSRYDRVRVIGFGKGSAPMAQAVHSLLADKITDGLVIVKYGHTLPADTSIAPIELAEAGHPIPDANSVTHTRRLVALLADSTPRDLILCLISGGGSALLTMPAEGLSLRHLQPLNQRLLEAGAAIDEINIIRKHLSQVKGGQLARRAHPATLINLILSDVGGDPLDIIASGPTSPDPSTFADALAVLKRYHLLQRTSPAVRAYLQAGAAGHRPETPKPGDPIFERVQYSIIGNNRAAVAAAAEAARRLGFHAAPMSNFIEGEARQVARKIASLADSLSHDSGLLQRPVALVMGGETTVTIRGSGTGGRNQELALAIALEIQGRPNLLVACFATDGNDGPTNAAGAFADGQTVARAAAIGLDAQIFLDNNNSYPFFQALDDLIITGPTNTNVNDLILLLAR